MFNDDVAAICSECGAGDVAMDAAKIICQSCGHFDALGLETEASSAELTNLSQAYAISVLQRWSFADYPLAPLLIGFILGTMMEDNFARAMQLYRGFGFMLERPMTLGLLILAVGLVFLPAYRARRARLRQVGVADGD